MTTIINLFGGPCVGKSTIAAGLFYILKTQRANVELVTEYAKELVWDNDVKALQDPIHVFAEQSKRINRLVGKVDYIITDAPLLLCLVHGRLHPLIKQLTPLVLKTHNSLSHCNIFLKRSLEYSNIGRNTNEESAITKDNMLKTLLSKENIMYSNVEPDLDEVIEWLRLRYGVRIT